MFLKNWYNAISHVMACGNVDLNYVNTSGSTFLQSNSVSYDIIGIGNSASNYYSPSMRKVRTELNPYSGVIFGSGTTPPTIDDYKLSGQLIKTISASASYTFKTDGDGIYHECLYTITNTGSEEITIGEVALLAGVGSSLNQKILVERTVLETPVTISAGGVGMVTYTIRLNYPT